MVPLALGPPGRVQHVDYNDFYVPFSRLYRFAQRAHWRDRIFAHLEKSPELTMRRLWQCVEANDAGRTPPSLDDLVPIWLRLAIQAACGILLLTCFLLLYRCLRLRVCRL